MKFHQGLGLAAVATLAWDVHVAVYPHNIIDVIAIGCILGGLLLGVEWTSKQSS